MIAEEAERALSLDAKPEKKEMERKRDEQLAQLQARAEELSELEETESTKVREVLKIIRRLYDELGCSHLINTDDTFQCDSSGQPIIADSNMLYFLGVIEQRARDLMNRLINEQAVAVDDGARRDITLSCLCPLGMGPSAPVGASKLNVQPPKIDTDDKSGDENDDDEEDDSRPMTQEELRSRMKKKLAGSRDQQNVRGNKSTVAQKVLQKQRVLP